LSGVWSKIEDLPPERIPSHVAIIMDGNGRWAKERGLPRIAGHRAGAEAVRRVVRAAGEFGIKVLTLYAFSTENWKRPRAEVEALMNLLRTYLRRELDELNRNNVRLQSIGRTEELPRMVQEELARAEEATKDNTGLILNLALNYGGRVEILDAVRALVKDATEGKVKVEDIDEELFGSYLYTRGLPDPDLLIRTSGEMRVSNFLLWQISYAELYFTPVYWPDFTREHLLEAILDYAKRERRFGTIGESAHKTSS